MNRVLFATMLKIQTRNMANYAIGMMAYMLLFLFAYPSIAKSSGFNSLLKSLPQNLVRVIGYQSGISHLSGYLAGEFYGLIYILILAIYVIITSTKLIAHLVDHGSIAYLLATPLSRTTIAVTQALVLLVCIIIIGSLTMLTALVGQHFLVRADPFNVPYFIEMNVVGMLLFFVIGAYSFVFSCLFQEERSALAASSILTLAFYALHVVAMLSPNVSWLTRLSIFSTFDPQKLVQGQGHFAVISWSLLFASLALFGVAVTGFRHRKLSL